MGLNENLKALREQKGWTQKELAESLGMSVASIVAYEQGQKKPSYDALLSLADVLETSLDRLCGVNSSPKTYTDVMRLIVKLVNCNHPIFLSGGGPDGTHASVSFERWLRDDSPTDGTVYALEEVPPAFMFYEGDEFKQRTLTTGPYAVFIDNPIFRFIGEYRKMSDLLEAGSIDRELFSMWLKKTYRKYDCPLREVDCCAPQD